MAASSQALSDRQAWKMCIGTILHEAAMATGQKPANTNSDIFCCFNVILRPLLSFHANSAALNSLETSANADVKQSRWTNRVWRLWINISHQQVAIATQALKQTEDYHNFALVLTQGLPIREPIFNLISKVKLIDQAREKEAYWYSTAFRLAFIAAVAWAAGVFAPVQWMVLPGKISLAASAVIYGGNWLSHVNNQASVQKAYYEIGRSANQILQQLCCDYNDKMNPVSSSGSYEAPYAEFVKPPDSPQK